MQDGKGIFDKLKEDALKTAENTQPTQTVERPPRKYTKKELGTMASDLGSMMSNDFMDTEDKVAKKIRLAKDYVSGVKSALFSKQVSDEEQELAKLKGESVVLDPKMAGDFVIDEHQDEISQKTERVKELRRQIVELNKPKLIQKGIDLTFELATKFKETFGQDWEDAYSDINIGNTNNFRNLPNFSDEKVPETLPNPNTYDKDIMALQIKHIYDLTHNLTYDKDIDYGSFFDNGVKGLFEGITGFNAESLFGVSNKALRDFNKFSNSKQDFKKNIFSDENITTANTLGVAENDRYYGNKPFKNEIAHSIGNGIGSSLMFLFASWTSGMDFLKVPSTFREFAKNITVGSAITGTFRTPANTITNLWEANNTKDILLALPKAYYNELTENLGEFSTVYLANKFPVFGKVTDKFLKQMPKYVSQAFDRALLNVPVEVFEDEVANLLQGQPNVFFNDYDGKRLLLSGIGALASGLTLGSFGAVIESYAQKKGIKDVETLRTDFESLIKKVYNDMSFESKSAMEKIRPAMIEEMNKMFDEYIATIKNESQKPEEEINKNFERIKTEINESYKNLKTDEYLESQTNPDIESLSEQDLTRLVGESATELYNDIADDEKLLTGSPDIAVQNAKEKMAKITQEAYNEWNLENNTTELELPSNSEVNTKTPELKSEENTNFQGYKGGFENVGKGTPEGDGKDIAMRQVADGFIGEITPETKEKSSTWTSFIEIQDKLNNRPGNHQKAIAWYNPNNITASIIGDSKVVILARNKEFYGQPLQKNTKTQIKANHRYGAEFVVGDMPNVDSQFIDYLNEIGAKYTIYHTGTTPRINVNQIEAQPTQPQATVKKVSDIVDFTEYTDPNDLAKQELVKVINKLTDPTVEITDEYTPNTTELQSQDDNLDKVYNREIAKFTRLAMSRIGINDVSYIHYPAEPRSTIMYGEKIVINLANAKRSDIIYKFLALPIIRSIKQGFYTIDFENDEEGFFTEDGKPGEIYLIRHNDVTIPQSFKTRGEAEAYIQKNNVLYNNLLKELTYGKGKEILDKVKKNYPPKKYEKFEIHQVEYDDVNITEEYSRILEYAKKEGFYNDDPFGNSDFTENREFEIGGTFYKVEIGKGIFKANNYNTNFSHLKGLPNVNEYGLSLRDFINASIDSEHSLYEVLKDIEDNYLKVDAEWLHFNRRQRELEFPGDFINTRTTLDTVLDSILNVEKSTLSMEQDFAIAELLALYTDNKINELESKGLIASLKELLSKIKDFILETLKSRKIELDKLPNNTTLNDIATLLAYSNSQIAIYGNQVVFTTPDGAEFEAYGEAVNYLWSLVGNERYETLGWDNLTYGVGENERENYRESFLKQNTIYAVLRSLIEQYKKINGISYNPEEIWSRGQEFVHLFSAYSKVDNKLFLKHLLEIIENKSEIGDNLELSFLTQDTESKRVLGTPKSSPDYIVIKAYPKSEDILFASASDNYTTSTRDVRQNSKAFTHIFNEIVGIAPIKTVTQPYNLDTIEPNLVNVADNRNRNELAIKLTKTNFRLEYGVNVPQDMKNIIDTINFALDKRYGVVNKPSITKNNPIEPQVTTGSLKETMDSIIKKSPVVKKYRVKYFNTNIGGTTSRVFDTVEEAEQYMESLNGLMHIHNIRIREDYSITKIDKEARELERNRIVQNVKLADLAVKVKQYPLQFIESKIIKHKDSYTTIENPFEADFNVMNSDLERQIDFENEFTRNLLYSNSAEGKKTYGTFNLENNHIRLFSNAIKSDPNPKGRYIQTLAHETIHAGTHRLLTSDIKLSSGKTFREEITELLNFYKANSLTPKGSVYLRIFASSNPDVQLHEFISEMFSNTGLQREANMLVSGKFGSRISSLFAKFVDLLREAFVAFGKSIGFDMKLNDNSLLMEVISVYDEALSRELGLLDKEITKLEEIVSQQNQDNFNVATADLNVNDLNNDFAKQSMPTVPTDIEDMTADNNEIFENSDEESGTSANQFIRSLRDRNGVALFPDITTAVNSVHELIDLVNGDEVLALEKFVERYKPLLPDELINKETNNGRDFLTNTFAYFKSRTVQIVAKVEFNGTVPKVILTSTIFPDVGGKMQSTTMLNQQYEKLSRIIGRQIVPITVVYDGQNEKRLPSTKLQDYASSPNGKINNITIAKLFEQGWMLLTTKKTQFLIAIPDVPLQERAKFAQKNYVEILRQMMSFDEKMTFPKVLKRVSNIMGDDTRALTTPAIIEQVKAMSSDGLLVRIDENNHVITTTVLLDVTTNAELSKFMESIGAKADSVGDGCIIDLPEIHNLMHYLNGVPYDKYGAGIKFKNVKQGELIKTAGFQAPIGSVIYNFMQDNNIGRIVLRTSLKIPDVFNESGKQITTWADIASQKKIGKSHKYDTNLNEQAFLLAKGKIKHDVGGGIGSLIVTSITQLKDFADDELKNEIIEWLNSLTDKFFDKLSKQTATDRIKEIEKFIKSQPNLGDFKIVDLIDKYDLKNNPENLYALEVSEFYIKNILAPKIKNAMSFKFKGFAPVLMPDLGKLTGYRALMLSKAERVGKTHGFSTEQIEAYFDRVFHTEFGILNDGYVLITEDVAKEHKVTWQDILANGDNTKIMSTVVPPGGFVDLKALRIGGIIPNNSYTTPNGDKVITNKNGVVVSYNDFIALSGKDFDIDTAIFYRQNKLWNIINKAGNLNEKFNTMMDSFVAKPYTRDENMKRNEFLDIEGWTGTKETIQDKTGIKISDAVFKLIQIFGYNSEAEKIMSQDYEAIVNATANIGLFDIGQLYNVKLKYQALLESGYIKHDSKRKNEILAIFKILTDVTLDWQSDFQLLPIDINLSKLWAFILETPYSLEKASILQQFITKMNKAVMPLIQVFKGEQKDTDFKGFNDLRNLLGKIIAPSTKENPNTTYKLKNSILYEITSHFANAIKELPKLSLTGSEIEALKAVLNNYYAKLPESMQHIFDPNDPSTYSEHFNIFLQFYSMLPYYLKFQDKNYKYPENNKSVWQVLCVIANVREAQIPELKENIKDIVLGMLQGNEYVFGKERNFTMFKLTGTTFKNKAIRIERNIDDNTLIFKYGSVKNIQDNDLFTIDVTATKWEDFVQLMNKYINYKSLLNVFTSPVTGIRLFDLFSLTNRNGYLQDKIAKNLQGLFDTMVNKLLANEPSENKRQHFRAMLGAYDKGELDLSKGQIPYILGMNMKLTSVFGIGSQPQYSYKYPATGLQLLANSSDPIAKEVFNEYVNLRSQFLKSKMPAELESSEMFPTDYVGSVKDMDLSAEDLIEINKMLDKIPSDLLAEGDNKANIMQFLNIMSSTYKGNPAGRKKMFNIALKQLLKANKERGILSRTILNPLALKYLPMYVSMEIVSKYNLTFLATDAVSRVVIDGKQVPLKAIYYNRMFNRSTPAFAPIQLSGSQIAFVNAQRLSEAYTTLEANMNEMLNIVLNIAQGSDFINLNNSEAYLTQHDESVYEIMENKHNYLDGYDVENTRKTGYIHINGYAHSIYDDNYTKDSQGNPTPITQATKIERIKSALSSTKITNLAKTILGIDLKTVNSTLPIKQQLKISAVAGALALRWMYDFVAPKLLNDYLASLRELIKLAKDYPELVSYLLSESRKINHMASSILFMNEDKLPDNKFYAPRMWTDFESLKMDLQEAGLSEEAIARVLNEQVADEEDIISSNQGATPSNSFFKKRVLKNPKYNDKTFNVHIHYFQQVFNILRYKHIALQYEYDRLKWVSKDNIQAERILTKTINTLLGRDRYPMPVKWEELKRNDEICFYDRVDDNQYIFNIGRIKEISGSYVVIGANPHIPNDTETTYSRSRISTLRKYHDSNIQQRVKEFLLTNHIISKEDNADKVKNAIKATAELMLRWGSKTMLGFKAGYAPMNYYGSRLNQLIFFGKTNRSMTATHSEKLNQLLSGKVPSEQEHIYYDYLFSNIRAFLGGIDRVYGTLASIFSTKAEANIIQKKFAIETQGKVNIREFFNELSSIRQELREADSEGNLVYITREKQKGALNLMKRLDIIYTNYGLYSFPFGLITKIVEGRHILQSPFNWIEALVNPMTTEFRVRTQTALKELQQFLTIPNVVGRNKLFDDNMDSRVESFFANLFLGNVFKAQQQINFMYSPFHLSELGSNPVGRVFDWFAHYTVSMNVTLFQYIRNTMEQGKWFKTYPTLRIAKLKRNSRTKALFLVDENNEVVNDSNGKPLESKEYSKNLTYYVFAISHKNKTTQVVTADHNEARKLIRFLTIGFVDTICRKIPGGIWGAGSMGTAGVAMGLFNWALLSPGLNAFQVPFMTAIWQIVGSLIASTFFPAPEPPDPEDPEIDRKKLEYLKAIKAWEEEKTALTKMLPMDENTFVAYWVSRYTQEESKNEYDKIYNNALADFYLYSTRNMNPMPMGLGNKFLFDMVVNSLVMGADRSGIAQVLLNQGFAFLPLGFFTRNLATWVDYRGTSEFPLVKKFRKPFGIGTSHSETHWLEIQQDKYDMNKSKEGMLDRDNPNNEQDREEYERRLQEKKNKHKK